MEETNVDLLASSIAAEKKDDGKVHPPTEAITFKLAFWDLYPIIV